MGSLLLTNVAASAPLAGAWTDMGAACSNGRAPSSRSCRHPARAAPSARRSGRTPITGVWTTNDDPFLTIEIAASEEEVPYLAAVVYDTFDKTGWTRSEPRVLARAAG